MPVNARNAIRDQSLLYGAQDAGQPARYDADTDRQDERRVPEFAS